MWHIFVATTVGCVRRGGEAARRAAQFATVSYERAFSLSRSALHIRGSETFIEALKMLLKIVLGMSVGIMVVGCSNRPSSRLWAEPAMAIPDKSEKGIRIDPAVAELIDLYLVTPTGQLYKQGALPAAPDRKSTRL